MKIDILAVPKEVPTPIRERVVEEVSAALNNVQTDGTQFIVNDTLWYTLTDKDKVNLCVMNKAEFISGGFLRALKESGVGEREAH